MCLLLAVIEALGKFISQNISDRYNNSNYKQNPRLIGVDFFIVYFQKTLDFSLKICYTIFVRGSKQVRESEVHYE